MLLQFDSSAFQVVEKTARRRLAVSLAVLQNDDGLVPVKISEMKIKVKPHIVIGQIKQSAE